jgi:hypothetical protein
MVSLSLDMIRDYGEPGSRVLRAVNKICRARIPARYVGAMKEEDIIVAICGVDFLETVNVVNRPRCESVAANAEVTACGRYPANAKSRNDLLRKAPLHDVVQQIGHLARRLRNSRLRARG